MGGEGCRGDLRKEVLFKSSDFVFFLIVHVFGMEEVVESDAVSYQSGDIIIFYTEEGLGAVEFGW